MHDKKIPHEIVRDKTPSDPSHIIFEINVGKGRIRQKTVHNLDEFISNQFGVDLKKVIEFHSRCISDPFFPTLISKIKWLGYGLPLIEIILGTSREIDRN